MKKMLKVLQGKSENPPPFWFMRQAGRYLPEYKQTRSQAGSFLNLCFNPAPAAEVTMQPLRRFGMDGAILFADILVIPLALGMDLKFETGEGPKLGELKIEDLRFDESKLVPIYQTLNILTTQLSSHATTLIGFAGAPWTVATYMVEGGSSREFAKTKEFSQKSEFKKLIDILVDSTSQYLISQIKNGAEVVQVFDSWAGALEGKDFEQWVIEPNAQIVANVRAEFPNIPIILFPKGAKDLQNFAKKTKPTALSLGSETNLEWALANLDVVIQGNLDPQILLSTKDDIANAAKNILKVTAGKPFIFNLGHGIDQRTNPEHVDFLSKLIRSAA